MLSKINIMFKFPYSNNKLYFFHNFSKKFCTEKVDTILYKQHNRFLTEITLNNPKSLNSLDMNMIKNLLKNCRRWLPENDPQEQLDGLKEESKNIKNETNIPKVVLMSGTGPKAFCAGGDVVSIYNLKKQNKPVIEVSEFFKYEYLTDFTIARMKPIQISIWNGIVMGGGVGVSINSPIRIATDNTLFAMPETKIGLIPDVGATYFLPRIFNNNVNVGLYFGLTGERLKGKDLVKCGLATHYVSQEKLEELKQKILESADENTNLQKMNQLCSSYSDIVFKDKDFSLNRLDEIMNVFQLDSLQSIIGRLNNLVDNGEEEVKNWASNILKNLNSFCPTSLVLHFEQMKRGIKIRSIEEAYEIELQVIRKILEGNEFTEGVRALLIEKDMKPVWQYNNINEINEKELLEEYFGRS